uniref:Enoyl reductase (ER) domain-containing protein n=1 Tax=Panagrolaimus sp. JU765 TaxID=591449 RepID=A0AC34RQ64_9BILA
MNVPKTQRALVVYDFSKGPVLETNFPVQEPGHGQILVNIKYSGVCHSDVELVGGLLPVKFNLPTIGGHEAVGIVAKIGPNVTGINVGDKVGIMMTVGTCQNCEYCKTASEFFCEDIKFAAVATHGTFQEYCVISALHAHKLPDGIDLAKAAPLHCAGVTTYRALKTSQLKAGEFVVITGAAGGLGSFALQFARAMGLRPIAIDLGQEKSQHCLNLGAEMFIDASDPEIDQKIIKYTNGGAHGAINIANSTKAIENMFNYVRKSGTIVLVGLPRDPFLQVNVKLIVAKGINIKGSVLGNRKDMDEVIEFFSRGVINVPIKLMGLSDVPQILEALHQHQVTGRVVIDPSK